MKRYLLLIIILGWHLVLLSQLVFTAWPEMLSYPYLVYSGFALYKDFIMPYPPGLVLFLQGVFNLFGFHPEVLKILTWILILIVDILVFVILRKLVKEEKVTLLFLFIFTVWQALLDGNMLWFDFATVIPLLAAFGFGLKWLENGAGKNLFLTSLFLTLAILIKQVAIVYFLAFGVVYLFSRGIRGIWGIRGIRELGVLGGGVLILIIPLIIYLLISDSLTYFWNWTILYPLTEWSKFPGYVQMAISSRQILFFLVLFSPLLGVFWVREKMGNNYPLLTCVIFFLAALLAIYPRFSYFHFQPALVFFVFILAQLYLLLAHRKRLIFLIATGVVIIVTAGVVVPGAIGKNIRFYSEGDIALSEKIKEQIPEGKKVFLLGINSSEYVFAHRLPSKNWSDNFGWYLEIPGVQEWVLQGFEEELPEKIFWRVPSEGNWYDLGAYQPQKITDFIRQNYKQTGKIEGVEIWSKKD